MTTWNDLSHSEFLEQITKYHHQYSTGKAKFTKPISALGKEFDELTNLKKTYLDEGMVGLCQLIDLRLYKLSEKAAQAKQELAEYAKTVLNVSPALEFEEAEPAAESDTAPPALKEILVNGLTCPTLTTPYDEYWYTLLEEIKTCRDVEDQETLAHMFNIRRLACMTMLLWTDLETLSPGKWGTCVSGLVQKIEDLRKADDKPLLAWDPNYAPGTNGAVPHYKWEYLITAYKNMQEAALALDWYEKHATLLSKEEVKPLLDCIGAAERILVKAAYAIGGTDYYAGVVYNTLVQYSNTMEIYLSSLRVKTPTSAMEEMASWLPDIWNEAKALMEEHLAARDEEIAQELARIAAIEALAELLQEPKFANVRNRRASRTRLCEALESCAKVGISCQDARVYQLIMPYVEWIKGSDWAIAAEQARRRLEARIAYINRHTDTDDTREEPVSEEALIEVREFTKDALVLVLGGEREPAATLKDVYQIWLEAGRISWPYTKAKDSASRLSTQIKQNKLTIVLTRFAETDWPLEVQRIGEENNRPVAFVNGGCHPSRVINAIHTALKEYHPYDSSEPTTANSV